MLTHYDIPAADPATWTVDITGMVDRELALSLEDLAAMEQHTVRVTMECAGNGRSDVQPRPLSQPWITGAVGTADWSGVRVRDVLADAGIAAGAVTWCPVARTTGSSAASSRTTSAACRAGRRSSRT